MSLYVILAVVVLTAFQPNLPRLLCGVFLMLGFGAFYLLDPHLSDIAYYVVAGVIDLLLVYVMGAVRPITLTTIRLQRACLASLVVNALGFLLWWAYIGAVYYNAAMWLVHLYILITMLRAGGHADSANNSYNNPVRFTYRPRLLTMQNNETTL